MAFKSGTIRFTADPIKNLSAASGVAYARLGAILTFQPAPKSILDLHRTVDVLRPTATLGRPGPIASREVPSSEEYGRSIERQMGIKPPNRRLQVDLSL